MGKQSGKRKKEPKQELGSHDAYILHANSRARSVLGKKRENS